MMNINLLDEELVSGGNELLEEDLDDNERYIRQDTGRRSLARWKAQGYHQMYTTARGHVKCFEVMWPHMDSLPSNEPSNEYENYSEKKYGSVVWYDRECCAMR